MIEKSDAFDTDLLEPDTTVVDKKIDINAQQQPNIDSALIHNEKALINARGTSTTV